MFIDAAGPSAATRPAIVGRRRGLRQDRRPVVLPVPCGRRVRPVIDVYLSARRDGRVAQSPLRRRDDGYAGGAGQDCCRPRPRLRTLDRRPGAAAWHRIERYANNPIECDCGRLEARLRPRRGLKRLRSARMVVAGQAFVQSLRQGHYELGKEVAANQCAAASFAELRHAI